MTDHPAPKLVVLSPKWINNRLSLVTVQTESLYEQIARPSEFVHNVFLDPYGYVGLAHCYTGKAKAFTINDGIMEDFCDVLCVFLSLVCLSVVY